LQAARAASAPDRIKAKAAVWVLPTLVTETVGRLS
jgi:hypothetical protein